MVSAKEMTKYLGVNHTDSILSRTHGPTLVITVYRWLRLTRRGQTQEEISFLNLGEIGCVFMKSWDGSISDVLQVVLETTVCSTFPLEGVSR